ncbi:MAG: citrate lyase subunit beta/citryl-CoA lyase [Afipia broomeae]|jgi:citrate lyase subunit beta/citryl-CoA lyase|uniref:HpcH/HpaI aldolase/citrate lyase family protein n=1 Tax=unclassified Afipia TaxID=2642050 RepID=UPI000464C2DC|nr:MULTISPECIES: CoA ester lyase [unclassified Afipia]MAH70604.1 CoA ester lyase [Afipia sp.]OUX60413.1 MAG: CoA ester lyase [Afipia sp. TMED4]RTL78029.1 MAG: CoA ester lyase [Bradyrhizobiaceae bacterium]HAO41679.1 CoA ester lyase [Afipia sp.]HAP46018.1 CoA ester lyase [Afipia sp.]
MIHPRRSVLFMPGSNARALDKARNLPCDGVILDLEDSVAPDAKPMARDQIAQAVAAGGFGKREIIIRINNLESPWWEDDLTMAAHAKPDGILVPKISRPADIKRLEERLRTLKADPGIVLWAMIESPLGVLSAQEIAATARDGDKRLAGFVMGPNDIARETRMRMLPGRVAMLPLFAHCILAARAYGLEILDGPYNDISDVAGFAKECAQGRDMGFDGKTLIHPGQIDAANAAYTPPAEEIARARKIMGVFDLPENANKGVVQLDGQMVERLHVEMAKRTIAIADAIAALKAS